jgi:hypothetical protein
LIASRTGEVLVNRHGHDRLGTFGRAVIDTSRRLKAKQRHGEDLVPDVMGAPVAMPRAQHRPRIRT